MRSPRSRKKNRNERTLGDIFESLVSSHICGVVFAKISRSKPGLDLEIQKVMVGYQKKIRRRLVECCRMSR
jgi:hypothetical protein